MYVCDAFNAISGTELKFAWFTSSGQRAGKKKVSNLQNQPWILQVQLFPAFTGKTEKLLNENIPKIFQKYLYFLLGKSTSSLLAA